ncbi:hypothetical protein BLA6863_05772 [Burkholderia lata]|uniref:Uncharacterized protein n=1 Tax=Burkholderia lata (strain ATCC 17760 / DSM 23089 / LMG 22485 / NCIMB 9086 / R18194 / 383) TaxID=482957 RepID=A0A6P2QB94_BURL3|nr:hypothetical protein BLA6863_05772 [Burkholderia lata]
MNGKSAATDSARHLIFAMHRVNDVLDFLRGAISIDGAVLYPEIPQHKRFDVIPTQETTTVNSTPDSKSRVVVEYRDASSR